SSMQWKSAEMEVVANCFAMGYIRKVTRGRRKNQIEITSPWSGNPPQDLTQGLFEANAREKAFFTYQDLHPWERSVWSILRDSPKLPSLGKNGLSKAASVIGIWLGFTIAIWNDVGEEMPDLWDIFSPDEDSPFLAFYEHCQEVRASVNPDGGGKAV